MFKMHFFLLFVQFLTGSSTLEKLELLWDMNLLMPLTIQVKCVCLKKLSTGISTHNCFVLPKSPRMKCWTIFAFFKF